MEAREFDCARSTAAGARKSLKKAMHWYAYKALKDQPNLSLRFSPRRMENRWLLRDTFIEDNFFIIKRELDDIFNMDSEMMVDKIWILICEALEILCENGVLDYLIQNKIKMIVHLKEAGFTRNQLFQLARIIEDHEFQDLIIPRI